MTINTDLALARLLRLASPVLPVGAFSYSQALEWMVEAGGVVSYAKAEQWIVDAFNLNLARCEAPVWLRLLQGWKDDDAATVNQWNDFLLATRESAELRAETVQMGRAMRTIILRSNEFDTTLCAQLEAIEEPSYPTAFTAAISAWQIEASAGLTAYLWAWAENQVVAAMKLVPLGQTDGQRLLAGIINHIPSTLDAIFACADDDIGAISHGLAIASAQHETQYSRLFRS